MKITRATKPGQRYYYEWIPYPLKGGASAYVFLAVDEFSTFKFNLGVENHITDDMVSEKVQMLVNLPKFRSEEPFELVIGGSEYAHKQINDIINPMGGTLIYNEALLDKFMTPIFKRMFAQR